MQSVLRIHCDLATTATIATTEATVAIVTTVTNATIETIETTVILQSLRLTDQLSNPEDDFTSD
jgi:hypothetical protein